MRFIFFTKTSWIEPPRLRHQLADMLVSRDHEVVFFEKPRYFFQKNTRTPKLGRISFQNTRQLIHHRLRLIPFLTFLNGRFELAQIENVLTIVPTDIIINFNYDYGFLEKYSSNTIITIINDDFIGHLPQWAQSEPVASLKRIIGFSKAVLAVSYPLAEQLTKLDANPVLMLPWARRPYVRPKAMIQRLEMFYWGSIGSLIDFDLVVGILNHGIIINFVGPLDDSEQVGSLMSHQNVRYLAPTGLDNLMDVVNRCCCSILPYDARNIQVQSITVNNRAFDLLACGLPLLYTRLPALLKAPNSVIKPCRNLTDFIVAYEECISNFDAYQNDIESFVSQHSEEKSYQIISELVS
jgi:hypothetical protein